MVITLTTFTCCESVPTTKLNTFTAAAIVNPDASVLTLITFNRLKCTRVSAIIKVFISVKKASCAALGHLNELFFFPFSLLLKKSVISAVTLA